MSNELTNLILDANLIVDCDEVLTNITPYWVEKMYNIKEELEEYLDFSEVEKVINDKNALANLVLNRKVYYLTEWLKRKDVNEIPKEVFDKAMRVYTHDSEFYDKVKLTRMGRGISMLAYHPSVKNVYVLTKCTEGTNYESKERFIKSIFPSNKLRIVNIPLHESKTKYIEDIDFVNGIIFEDELKNINEYIDHEKVKECILYMPKLGYNTPTLELAERAENAKINLKRYELS